ncbi:hypothetical protein [Streptomyces parvus]|uniref:Uncharacterized protein n=1 Tax=Streptomyces parvus TaxID=66428 RepID=A0A7K3RT05_9ACTN|nr:hypothetical protein [Streptomyces parvus]NEC18294.1 hypothetical protein [Streptomyces parvus]
MAGRAPVIPFSMGVLAAPHLSARPGEHAAELVVEGGEDGRLRVLPGMLR